MISLPVFVMVGSLTEEIIVPIPSPLVATMAGSIAADQGRGVLYVLFICAIGTAVKTLGAWLFYFLADKLEDVLVPKFGRYIGVRHEDLERFGAHFHGSGRDTFILCFLRSIPVMPSTPISVVCGILKIEIHTFLLATFVGFYLRNLCFIILGYTGLSAMSSLMQGIDLAETVMKFLVVGLFLLGLGWLYWKRRSGHPFRLPRRRR